MITSTVVTWSSWTNQIAQQHWRHHLAVMWQIAVVIALMAFLDCLLKRCLFASSRYLIWCLIIIKLLLPIGWSSPFGVTTLASEITTHLFTRYKSISPTGTNNSSSLPTHVTPPLSVDSSAVAANRQPAPTAHPIGSDTNTVLMQNELVPATWNPGQEQTHALADRHDPSLTLEAWLFLVWLAAVVCFVIFVVRHFVEVRRIVGQSTEVSHDEEDLVQQCARQLRLSRVSVALRATTSLTSPAIYGFLRPTILMPNRLLVELGERQRCFVYVHELRHWQRGDIHFNWLQLFVQIAFWYNPLVWWVNSVVRRLREVSVDESVTSIFAGEWREYAQTLLAIVAPTEDSNRFVGTLLQFGERRSQLSQRIKHMATRHYAPSWRSRLTGALLFVLVSALILPSPSRVSVQADESTVTEEAASATGRESSSGIGTSNSTAKVDYREMTPEAFRIVATDEIGTVVRNSQITITSDQRVTPPWIVRGQIASNSPTQTIVDSDVEGVVAIRFPEAVRYWRVQVDAPSFAPALYVWNFEINSQAIPAQLTVPLARAFSAEGIVINEQGNPVPNVSVEAGFVFHPRSGPIRNDEVYHFERATTDTEGRWRLDEISTQMTNPWKPSSLKLIHPDYAVGEILLDGATIDATNATIAVGKAVIESGVTVQGRVTDEDGQPISKARVFTTRTWGRVQRETTTNENGRYRLEHCTSANSRIVVISDHHAITQKTVDIRPGLLPVDFVVPTKHPRRMIVLDKVGQPIANARIALSDWGPYIHPEEFREFDRATNDQGIWEWANAPAEEFSVSVSAPGYMTRYRQTVPLRGDLQTASLVRRLHIAGDVINAETKKPVETFRVIPIEKEQQQRAWGGFDLRLSDAFVAKDGRFEMTSDHEAFAHGVRIEALGFVATEIDDIPSDAGTRNVTFELQPVPLNSVRILSPDGTPAVKAQVAVADKGLSVDMENNVFRSVGTRAEQHETNELGQCQLSVFNKKVHIIVIHPNGCAKIVTVAGTLPDEIHLEPWGRVEGVFHRGKNIVPNEYLTATQDSRELAYVSSVNLARSDTNGRFVFQRLFPGSHKLIHPLGGSSATGYGEATTSHVLHIDVVPGDTTVVNYGGDGELVEGRLQLPEGVEEQVSWSFAEVSLRVRLPKPPEVEAPDEIRGDPKKRQAWYSQWLESQEGRAWQAAREARQNVERTWPEYQASTDRHGRFQIYDVRPGDYNLSVHSLFDGRFPWGILNFAIHVPAQADKTFVDVGAVPLRPLAELREEQMRRAGASPHQ